MDTPLFQANFKNNDALLFESPGNSLMRIPTESQRVLLRKGKVPELWIRTGDPVGSGIRIRPFGSKICYVLIAFVLS